MCANGRIGKLWMALASLSIVLFHSVAAMVYGASGDPSSAALAKEVRSLGWIVYGARSDERDWDLFLMRPDGSAPHNLTHTKDFNEGMPRFSPDGTRILYRRLPRGEHFDNNRHGMQGELVVRPVDSSGVQVLGPPGDYPWASWGPQGEQIACLSVSGVYFVDLASRTEVSRRNRSGFFQQMAWSPDGLWLCGVANSFGTGWSVARMEVATGRVNAVSTVDCCTPDWFPDSRRIIYSHRPGQWTQLWQADADGRQRSLVYAEDGRHVYGGCVSPDGRYVLFTGNHREDGDAERSGAPMALMRLADAPIIAGASPALRKQHPNANEGPVLILPDGWEPHWTAHDLPGETP